MLPLSTYGEVRIAPRVADPHTDKRPVRPIHAPSVRQQLLLQYTMKNVGSLGICHMPPSRVDGQIVTGKLHDPASQVCYHCVLTVFLATRTVDRSNTQNAAEESQNTG